MIIIRDASESDREAIVRLINTAFLVELFFIERDRTNPEMVRSLMEKGKFLLAKDGTSLAGCVYVELRGEGGYFGLLAVEPARQGGGLGSGLVAASEEYCRAAGCRFMDLTVVNLRNELLPLYRRLGYIESGTIPFPSDQHPPNQPCHLVRMSKSL